MDVSALVALVAICLIITHWNSEAAMASRVMESQKRSSMNRSICQGSSADLVQLVATLSAAFQNDPALSWILPDPAQRRLRLPKLFNIIVRSDLSAGTVLRSQSYEAVTLWRAPGKARMGLMEAFFSGPGYFQTFVTALGPALAVSHAIEAHYPRGIDYWYLHYAAVRPEHQGAGWGGAAIRKGLTRARSEGLPVYLETVKESNVAIYLKLGFKVIGEWDVPNGGPHFWSMLNENGKWPR
jgi:ribosomal protein S18 acetylase RimI-like enzyme